MSLLDRYNKINERIAAAAAKARRSPSEITLVAVTKSATPEAIRQLLEAGHQHIAESRVQQLQQRAAQIQEWIDRRSARGAANAIQPPIWHMVGHLQRNKVKPVLQICRYIHSCDSLRLAEEIQSGVEKEKITQPTQVFLEVNVSGEASKYGVAVGAALHLAEQIDTMDGLQLVGLMTMAPITESTDEARPYFARLREIFEEIRFRKIGGNHFKHLSMGMSGDFEAAILEGATMVRIGTALFG
jgi:PLP dependent protein